MSTTLISNRSWHSAVRGAILTAMLCAFSGCTYTGGKLLYMLGLGEARTVPAEFTLTKEPVLIFVDDFRERLTYPLAARDLFGELSQELLRQKAATKLIPLSTVDGLRQSHPEFSELSAREIGELVGADQVLWIEIQDFLASDEVTNVDDAGYIHVTLKVLDPHETKRRSRIRLWPISPTGHPVSVGISGARVSELGSAARVSKELTTMAAVEIAKRFYDCQLGDFEKER